MSLLTPMIQNLLKLEKDFVSTIILQTEMTFNLL
jgi:hypothetical protein